ncbi:MAG: hypothetical protein OEY32_15875 [Candidatus Krumholzibacteria bacterium]|nr:hypothetical protein [Candidatus Krumholzibacteria bacterium]MDH5271393.1 hypothetical protein [Candidatus Krumholzibacteria bacterium]
MPLVVGAILAVAVGLMGTGVGLDRDRSFYPTITIVVASYYVLFAVMGAPTQTLVLETLIGVAFVLAALIGFRSSLWLVAGALAAHGLFDLVHDRVISNTGMPVVWPPFCFAYDVVAAGYLAWLLKRGHVPGRPKAELPHQAG